MYQSMEEYIQNPSNWTPDLEDGYHITVGQSGIVVLRFFYSAPNENRACQYGIEVESNVDTTSLVERTGTLDQAFLWFEKSIPLIKTIMQNILILQKM